MCALSRSIRVEIEQGRGAGSLRCCARGGVCFIYIYFARLFIHFGSLSLSLSIYMCVCAKRACAGAEKIRYESKQSAQLALASTPPPPQEPLGTGEAAGLLLLGVDDLGEGDCSHGASSRMRSIWFW